jgi:hypothetical protein
MISDKALFDILKPTEDIDAHKEERVKLVIEHVEFEQKTNDIITFTIGNTFSTLMVLLAPLFALLGKYTQK